VLKSTTGYGRAQQVIDGKEILVEIRAVNHRYYEFSSRLPRAYSYLDEKLKSFLQGRLSRGKVEGSVSINHLGRREAQIQLNHAIARGYITALREANASLCLQDDLSLSELIRFPDIFNVQKQTEDENEIWAAVSSVAADALDVFVKMRETEGARLCADLQQKLSGIETMLAQVEEAVPRMTEQYRERLYNKLTEILKNVEIDPQRVLTEAAIFSEKTAVDEETVRLHSHIAQFRTLLEATDATGRKLDFLVQEMNREVNTIGSKAQDITITRVVVDLKSEIEKIREQIQNLE